MNQLIVVADVHGVRFVEVKDLSSIIK